MKTYSCASCGAKMIVSEVSHYTNCLYCGNTIAVQNEEIDDLNIKKIIPFSIDKEQAIAKFKKIVNETITDVKKVYIPIRFCNYKFSYLFSFVQRIEYESEDGTHYSYKDREMLLDGTVSDEVIFGSSKISRFITDDIFIKQNAVDYNPSLIGDVSVELSKFYETNYEKEQEKDMESFAESYFKQFDIVKVYSRNYFITDFDIDDYSTLIPVYIVKTNRYAQYSIPGINFKKPQKTPTKSGNGRYNLITLLIFVLFLIASKFFMNDNFYISMIILIIIAVLSWIQPSLKRNKVNFDSFYNFHVNVINFNKKKKKLR